MNELETFCSRYLEIEDRFTRDELNDDSNPNDEVIGTMSSFPSGFKETDALFLKFNDVGGSSSMDENLGESWEVEEAKVLLQQQRLKLEEAKCMIEEQRRTSELHTQ
ncbi:cytochrome P450 CYP82D47-like [Cucumis melo var. makuwa]|uniref:Cytochrome P450 CYP82D47-like n=1 Tax=Cucumis melo var. makuwa TaxID=1194695 RepID=A0A5D3BC88_CUCMM|nr:cytochrome P450 CYP82D47-like [Cucumis melo var. makuwa]